MFCFQWHKHYRQNETKPQTQIGFYSYFISTVFHWMVNCIIKNVCEEYKEMTGQEE